MNKLPISKKVKTAATALLLATVLAIPAPVKPISAAEIANVNLTVSNPASASLKLNKQKATLYPGKTLKLSVGNIAAKNITWATSNPKIVKVNSKGVVTAVKKGTAVITAVYKGKAYNCTITVELPSLNTSLKSLSVNDTLSLKLTGTTAVSYTSTNPKVAKVNSNGTVTALSEGTTTIKVTGKDGNTYKSTINVYKKYDMDLGGMEILIRGNDLLKSTLSEDYNNSVSEWIDYIQKTYNFKISTASASLSGDIWSFTDYVDNFKKNDKSNYVFGVNMDSDNPSNALHRGYMYNLATLSWFDFTSEKFTLNKTAEIYTKGDAIYGMNTGYAVPSTGVYFNKELLKNVGIDPETIYDMQKKGTWTWDAFEELCEKVQRDTNKDGTPDYYAVTAYNSKLTKAAIYSNGSSIIGKLPENSSYGTTYYTLPDETKEAVKWVVDIYDKYDNRNNSSTSSDYYKSEFLSGNVAFLVDDVACGIGGNYLSTATFDMGFVMFPKGPKAETCVNYYNDYFYAIPSCYDKTRAEKIAFALNLYTQEPANYKNSKDVYLSKYSTNSIFDSRAVKETISMMMDPKHGAIDYAPMAYANMSDILIRKIGPGVDADAVLEYCEMDWGKAVAELDYDYKY